MSVDVRKVKVGDALVFQHPKAGYAMDVDQVQKAELMVGDIHEVREIALSDFSCQLKFVGSDAWFNSVHFELS